MTKSIDSAGYYIIYMPSHHRARSNGVTYEQYIIAEEKLGRLLRDGEVVHHEDEDKLNNHPDNLYVFATVADHSRYHKTGRREQVEDYWISPVLTRGCKQCGKTFEYRESHDNTFCSIECMALNNRVIARPTKEELHEMIKTKSFTQIGKDYGVSDNAIRKWCKYYGLPYRKKDLKQL
jgi:hypothetical protein